MRIIDTQLHGIGPWADWTGESTQAQHRIFAETMVANMNAIGVDSAVIFPPKPDQPAAEAAAAAMPDRFAFVARIASDVPDKDAEVRAAKANRKKGQLGVRTVLGHPLDGTEIKRFDEGAYDAVYAACEREQALVFLFISGWLPRAAEIARRYPKLTLIIDHIGLRQPPLDDAEDPPFRSLPDLLALAKFPNVNLKFCGLPALSKEAFPFNDVVQPMRAIVDAFGAERLMWASDTSRFTGTMGLHRHADPRTLGAYVGKHTYAEALFFIRDNKALSASEKDAILGGTAQRVLGWPDAA